MYIWTFYRCWNWNLRKLINVGVQIRSGWEGFPKINKRGGTLIKHHRVYLLSTFYKKQINKNHVVLMTSFQKFKRKYNFNTATYFQCIFLDVFCTFLSLIVGGGSIIKFSFFSPEFNLLPPPNLWRLWKNPTPWLLPTPQSNWK